MRDGIWLSWGNISSNIKLDPLQNYRWNKWEEFAIGSEGSRGHYNFQDLLWQHNRDAKENQEKSIWKRRKIILRLCTNMCPM